MSVGMMLWMFSEAIKDGNADLVDRVLLLQCFLPEKDAEEARWNSVINSKGGENLEMTSKRPSLARVNAKTGRPRPNQRG